MEEKLSREEILEKSRQENRKGDERERTIRVEGESFSLLFALLMGLISAFLEAGPRPAGRGCDVHVLDGLRGQPALPADPAQEYV